MLISRIFESVLAVFIVGAALTAPQARAQQSVLVTWTASSSASGNPSLTYNVYRSTGCSETFVSLNTAPVSVTSYVDSTAFPGSYCYRVTAVASGTESTPSNLATAIVPVLPASPASMPSGAKQSGCSHRGSMKEWLRCIAELPRPPAGK